MPLEFYMQKNVVFKPDPVAWKHFTQDKTGVIGSDLLRRGRKLQLLARSSVGKDTGELAASIDVSYFPFKNPYVKIGSDISYAYYVHEGTHPWSKTMPEGKKMRFKVGGKIVYASEVNHPGTQAQKYLERHLRKVI